MSEKGFCWKGGFPQPLAAASRLFGGPPGVPTNDTGKQGLVPTYSSYGYQSDVKAVTVEPLADNEYVNEVCRNVTVVTAIVTLLAVFQFTPANKLSNFYARKLTHITMGVCLLACKPVGHLYMKLIILAVGTITVLSCFVMPFRFSRKGDKGVILYNIIVCVWVLLDFPLTALGPMFCADPCGAIAGTLFRSPRWIRNKTVVGSFAVFVTTFMTVFSVTSWTHRLILAAVCCLLEAVGGSYDNALIAAPLIAYFFVFPNQCTRAAAAV